MTTPVDPMEGGVLRVTLPMPVRPGHVHAYLLPGDDGWTVVDTGLGLPDARERWAAVLDGVDGPVARIFITHFHPDHVGAARDVQELTGAPVHQGALDYEQCERTWHSSARQDVNWAWLRANGVPDAEKEEMRSFGQMYRDMTRYAPDPIFVEAGDRLDGWELVAAPGHADGQLMLLKDGILVAGDHLLPRISPAIGLWPDSSPDPLGDYLGALAELPQQAASRRTPGPRRSDRRPARPGSRADRASPRAPGRARRGARRRAQNRLRALVLALRSGAPPAGRSFAVTETASHLERLRREERAERESSRTA